MNIASVGILQIMELWPSYGMQYVRQYASFYYVCCFGVFSIAH